MSTNPATEYHANPDLSDTEQAIIDADKAEQVAAEQAKAAEAAPPVETPPEPAPDPVAEALAANAAETRALRERLEAQEAQRIAEAKAAAEAAAPPPRDFDAERAALEKRFDEDDDFTLADRLAAEREIASAEAKQQAAAEFAEAEAARLADAQAAQNAAEDAAWDKAWGTFFTDPGNAALIENNIKKAAFAEAIKEAAAEGADSYEHVLIKAREKITGIPAVDTDAKIREANFQRNKDANAVAPNTLRDVPNTSNPGDNPGAALDNLDISSLEDALAKMSEADRDRYLANAPGGLQDNPRAA